VDTGYISITGSAGQTRRVERRWVLSARLLMFAMLLLTAPMAASAQPASLVRVDKVRIEALSRTVPVIGRLVAQRSGDVPAEIEGVIGSFSVEVGDRVVQDQAIAVLKVDSLKARLDLANAEFAQAQAELASVRAELRLARQEDDRLEEQRKTGVYSKGRFDDSLQKVAMAEAKMNREQATVRARAAAVELARINLAKTRIVAPYDGVVTRRMSETGSYVKSGDPLVHLMSDRALEIEAEVPYSRLGGLTPGFEVDFELDDGSRHRATVRAILPVENPLTRTRPVRFVPRFRNLAAALADAQSATVFIPVGARRDVLTVHKDAVIKRNGRDLVYVIAKKSAQPRQVELGIAVGGRMEIKRGLKAGDTVVIRGNERLRPGEKVRIDGAGG